MSNKKYYFNLATAIGFTLLVIVGFGLIFLRFEESLTPQHQIENKRDRPIING